MELCPLKVEGKWRYVFFSQISFLSMEESTEITTFLMTLLPSMSKLINGILIIFNLNNPI
jgi:hypothetical protein